MTALSRIHNFESLESLKYIICIYVCMANKLITLRLGDKLLKEIDSALKESSFENRTDFIKHAVRLMLKELKDRQNYEEGTEEAEKKEKEFSKIVQETMEELHYVH